MAQVCHGKADSILVIILYFAAALPCNDVAFDVRFRLALLPSLPIWVWSVAFEAVRYKDLPGEHRHW